MPAETFTMREKKHCNFYFFFSDDDETLNSYFVFSVGRGGKQRWPTPVLLTTPEVPLCLTRLRIV